MKMYPESPEAYLLKTEHAVRFLFSGLDSCLDYYKRALEHWDISKVNEPMTKENQYKLHEYLQNAQKYFDLKFSEGTFAGSILQVASMGISFYSRNSTIPDCCKSIITDPSHKAVQYCIGRQAYGLPIGLIICAGRNQYNHWDEKLRPIPRKVFQIISAAKYNSIFDDLAYDLSNPTIIIYANELLLGVLKWFNYEDYYSDLKDLLIKS